MRGATSTQSSTLTHNVWIFLRLLCLLIIIVASTYRLD